MDLTKKLKSLSLNKTSKCELTDLTKPPDYTNQSKCHFHKTIHKATEGEQNIKNVRLKITYGSYEKSSATENLLKDIGGGDRIRQMATRFYAHAFEDTVLSKFQFMDDGAPSHGQRFGDWLIEQMGGEGDVWSESGRLGMRQDSHHKAWASKKREVEKRYQHFKVDDCRIWMRVMFWSAREVGLDKHEGFMNWFIEFITHFIAVYERRAVPYTKIDAEWSKNELNIKEYKDNGYSMNDVIGIERD